MSNNRDEDEGAFARMKCPSDNRDLILLNALVISSGGLSILNVLSQGDSICPRIILSPPVYYRRQSLYMVAYSRHC